MSVIRSYWLCKIQISPKAAQLQLVTLQTERSELWKTCQIIWKTTNSQWQGDSNANMSILIVSVQIRHRQTHAGQIFIRHNQYAVMLRRTESPLESIDQWTHWSRLFIALFIAMLINHVELSHNFCKKRFKLVNIFTVFQTDSRNQFKQQSFISHRFLLYFCVKNKKAGSFGCSVELKHWGDWCWMNELFVYFLQAAHMLIFSAFSLFDMMFHWVSWVWTLGLIRRHLGTLVEF